MRKHPRQSALSVDIKWIEMRNANSHSLPSVPVGTKGLWLEILLLFYYCKVKAFRHEICCTASGEGPTEIVKCEERNKGREEQNWEKKSHLALVQPEPRTQGTFSPTNLHRHSVKQETEDTASRKLCFQMDEYATSSKSSQISNLTQSCDFTTNF